MIKSELHYISELYLIGPCPWIQPTGIYKTHWGMQRRQYSLSTHALLLLLGSADIP